MRWPGREWLFLWAAGGVWLVAVVLMKGVELWMK